MSKALPHHLVAEQSVLGSVFLDPKKIVHVIDKLTIEDFFDLKHQLIYQAMIQVNSDDLSIDYTSVMAKLEQAKNLGKAGGLEYLLELSDFVPSTTHLDSHIDLVIDGSLKRQVIDVSSNILKSGYEEDIDANEYIAKAEEQIFQIAQKRKTSEFSHIAKVIEEVREKIENNKNNKGGITGLKTGFTHLDRVTAGLQPEELLILAARPSMGKSAFALNLALNIAKRNRDSKAWVAIFSLEMSNDQLATRMLSSEADIDAGRLKSGNLDGKDWANLTAGKMVLENLNIVFDDSAAVSVSDIRAKCRKLSQEGKLDFVIIDYLQLIKGESKNGNRQEEVAKISRSLKQMARELKIPVLALSQLSRAVETRDDKRPVLADLRESGSIEQDADIVLFLFRQDYYERDPEKKTGDVDLGIAKNRQGQSGIDLHFKFDPAYSRFTTKEERDDDYTTRD
ncbi:replicative DNA helicase [Haploplasma axanthum]|uniref:Replicative DNA helicase n=1 Tax=Haploplasma axanthum TaxID=29552 RepID=A0A449BCR7_HAPAX|nr:replicative DNA helicase [Haploplasma axanthum]VEU80222.1 Replicative DNA helicase [Haploplasma axanthum]